LTTRFGEITIGPESFDLIVANDVLEHLPDLVTAMTNCLKLLKIGGEMQIHVPYDLSYGAWQDPTHVRGFNENSWLYYTDWAWYLGWYTERFKMTRFEWVLSRYGQSLIGPNHPFDDDLIRAPRAVDAMQVTLMKVKYE
jgi:SAM-dependent methyltransferase